MGVDYVRKHSDPFAKQVIKWIVLILIVPLQINSGALNLEPTFLSLPNFQQLLKCRVFLPHLEPDSYDFNIITIPYRIKVTFKL